MVKIKTITSKEDSMCPSQDNGSIKYIPLLYSVKRWRKLIGYCFALSAVMLLYGYDFVIVGTVSAMPAFQHKFGEKLTDSYIIPAVWLSVWSAAGPIGMMAGSLIGGYLQDHRGRRASLCAGIMLSAAAVALCYVSDLPDAMDARRGIFLGGKLIQGFATGMMLCVVQTYMSEVLPTNLRGPILAFFPLFTLLGQLIGAVVVHLCSKSKSTDSYRIAFASQWPLAGMLLVVAAFLPESPSWLMRGGRIDQALRSQQRLGIAEPDTRPIGEEIGVLNDAGEQTPSSNAASYMDCFKGTHRRRTFIIAFASILPQLFGLTLLSNASYFLQMVGMDANNSTLFLILGIGLGFLSNIVSVWALSAYGRRLLSLMTLGIATILWLAMGVAGCFSGVVVIWYTAASMMAIVVACGVGVWPASHVIAAETSSLHLRAKAQGIGWFACSLTTAVFSIILPYIYNADKGNLKGKTGFVLAGFAVLGFIGTYVALPEMKGRNPAQIDHMFDLKLPTRSFNYWNGDVTSTEQANESNKA